MTMSIRSFTSQLDDPVSRSVDDDAPTELRQEFVDVAFSTIEQSGYNHDFRLY
jgi:hypothetical protein